MLKTLLFIRNIDTEKVYYQAFTSVIISTRTTDIPIRTLGVISQQSYSIKNFYKNVSVK